MAETEGDTLPNQRGARGRGAGTGTGRGRGRGDGAAGSNEPVYSKRVILVKGLPLSATEASIRPIFEEKGKVASVRVKEYENGKTFSFGYDDPQAAAAALTLNQENIEGSVVTVEPLRLRSTRSRNYSRGERERPAGGSAGSSAGSNAGAPPSNMPRVQVTEANPKRVFVGNLRRKITKEVLEETLKDYGMVSIEMSQNGNFAFVEFASAEQADTVVNELDEASVNDQVIRVKKEEARTPRPLSPRRPRGPPAGGAASSSAPKSAAKPAGGEGEEGANGARRSRYRRRAPNPTRVFMGGVPTNCEVSVIQAKFPGIKKGSVRNQVAFVFFETPEQADAAVARNGEAVFGAEPVRIEHSRS